MDVINIAILVIRVFLWVLVFGLITAPTLALRLWKPQNSVLYRTIPAQPFRPGNGASRTGRARLDR